MKKYIITCIATVGVLALAACSEEKPLAHVSIQCGNYPIVAKVYKDRLSAVIDDKSVSLKQEVSASGAKYDGFLSGNPITLWNKGDMWTMFINDNDAVDCVQRAEPDVDSVDILKE